MSQVTILYRLQKIDSKRDQLLARLKEIESSLSNDPALRDSKQQAEDAELQLAKAQDALKDADNTSRSTRVKIEEAEAALYGGKIKSPKELQDIQKEIASLKRHLAVLEDRQIEAMVTLEEKEAANAQAEAKHQQSQLNNKLKNGDLSLEQQALTREVERLNAERQAASGSLTQETLQLYERLRKQKSGIALALVEDESCQVCGSSLTPAECQAARSPSRLTFCGSCGRILYAG